MTCRIDPARSSHRLAGRLLAVALLAVPLMGSNPAPARAGDITITETGSTLLQPLFDIWVPEYTKTHPGVQIRTSGTGSGAGEQQALSGQVMIGASDAYMSDAQVRAHPGFINVPLAISAQTVNYNLPGVDTTNLRLDGPTIAGIYTGSIRQWDAPQIVALNPGVTLPHKAIIPVHRSDGSGDTFVFTQFLTYSSPAWEHDKGYATTVEWPKVQGSAEAEGNLGMVKALQETPYAIGYIGISYSDAIAKAELGTAMLKNEAGAFVLPTREAIIDGAASLGVRTPPDERLSLVYAPGASSYPLVNYEYAVVSTKQPDAATAAALRRFLLWTIVPSEDNASYLDRVHFVPLPPHIWELSQAQIQSIQ